MYSALAENYYIAWIFWQSLLYVCSFEKKNSWKYFVLRVAANVISNLFNCLLFLSEGEFVIILLRIIYLVDRFYRKSWYSLKFSLFFPWRIWSWDRLNYSYLNTYVNNTYYVHIITLIEFKKILHDIFMNKSNSKTNDLKTNLFMTCIKMSHILLSFHKLHVIICCTHIFAYVNLMLN